jgi:histidinol-phosphate/aromatic aminotransferase/cobyric acid decarboxylase-like protein
VGYAVIRDERLKKYYRKVSPPFSIPTSAMEMIPLILKERDYLPNLRARICELKREVTDIVLSGKGFSIAPSCETVPIMTVTYEDDDIDLYDVLLEKGGIKTEPGWGFENMKSNSVRLRVPEPDRMDTFRKCWEKICRELENRP